MSKTQEEITQLKSEYKSLTNKLKELTEDELKLVTGGDVDPNTNLHFISPELQIASSEGTCKPYYTWVSKEINGKPYVEKMFVCSDFSLKGKKPECLNCPANK